MNQLFEEIKIWQVIAIYVFANIFNYVIGIGLKSVFHFSSDMGGELARYLMFGIVICWFAMIIVRNKVSLQSEWKRLKSDLDVKEGIAVLALNYGISIGMILGILLAVTQFMPDAMNALSDSAAETQELGAAWVGLLGASVIAPIAEELMFRGVLLNRLKLKHGILAAIIISSALFGFTHLSIAMLRSAIFGACMCIVYLRTKNILVPISLHMIYNFILTMVGSYKALFGFQVANSVELLPSTGTTMLYILVCIIVTVVSTLYLQKKRNFFNLNF